MSAPPPAKAAMRATWQRRPWLLALGALGVVVLVPSVILSYAAHGSAQRVGLLGFVPGLVMCLIHAILLERYRQQDV